MDSSSVFVMPDRLCHTRPDRASMLFACIRSVDLLYRTVEVIVSEDVDIIFLAARMNSHHDVTLSALELRQVF